MRISDWSSDVCSSDLVAHLDTPLSEGDATQVVYLKYAKAADLVPVLEQLADTLTGPASKSEDARPVSIQIHEATNAMIITDAPTVFRALSSVTDQQEISPPHSIMHAVILQEQRPNYNSCGCTVRYS